MFKNNIKSRRCKECERGNKEEIKSPTAVKVCVNGTYNHDITLHQMLFDSFSPISHGWASTRNPMSSHKCKYFPTLQRHLKSQLNNWNFWINT